MLYNNSLTIWKPQQKVFSHFSDMEAAAIIDKADGPKYRYFFMTLLGTGLRIGEVLAIRVKELIDGMDGFTLIFVREKKGEHTHTERLPIAQELGRTLKDYCDAAKLQPNDYISPVMAILTDTRFEWQPRPGPAGLEHAHPHQFRHSFVYGKVSQVFTAVLTSLVGHSSLQVTQQDY